MITLGRPSKKYPLPFRTGDSKRVRKGSGYAVVWGWVPHLRLPGSDDSNQVGAFLAQASARDSHGHPPHWAGLFQREEAWAQAGLQGALGRTRSISIEVTDAELEQIVKRMKAISSDGSYRYQIVPSLVHERAVFPSKHLNCLTAMREILKEIKGVHQFLPPDGSMLAFMLATERFAVDVTTWQGCGMAITELSE